jgi:hypothetical protein
MKIHFDYRNANDAHCDVVIFIDGQNVGTLRVGQSDVVGLQQIVSAGCARGIDQFNATGHSLPEELQEP